MFGLKLMMGAVITSIIAFFFLTFMGIPIEPVSYLAGVLVVILDELLVLTFTFMEERGRYITRKV